MILKDKEFTELDEEKILYEGKAQMQKMLLAKAGV